jgi:hypothetical protein
MNGQATRMEPQMNERTDWEREWVAGSSYPSLTQVSSLVPHTGLTTESKRATTQ